jgi:hypothetical protein
LALFKVSDDDDEFANAIPIPIVQLRNVDYSEDTLAVAYDGKELRIYSKPFVPGFLGVQSSHRTPPTFSGDEVHSEAWLEGEMAYLRKDAGVPSKKLIAKEVKISSSCVDIKGCLTGPRKMKLACPICGILASYTCKGCNHASYCSREHQVQDWKRHKKRCVVWKVEKNEELGRHLVAVRPLTPGALILKEYALVSGPTNGDGFLHHLKFDVSEVMTPEEMEGDQTEPEARRRFTVQKLNICAGGPPCLGCYLELNDYKSGKEDEESEKRQSPYLCPGCGWPLCSLGCFGVSIMCAALRNPNGCLKESSLSIL